MRLISFLFGLTTCSFIGCFPETDKHINHIHKICFATGGCYGTCPYMAIEIDSSLSYKFYGGEHSEIKGYFKGNVSEGFWDSLNLKLQRIDFTKLDSFYEHSVDDLSTEMIVYYGNERKRIRGQSGSLPDSVMVFYTWLMNSYKQIHLQTITENEISAETRLLIRNLTPPPPIMETTRFIPPGVLE